MKTEWQSYIAWEIFPELYCAKVMSDGDQWQQEDAIVKEYKQFELLTSLNPLCPRGTKGSTQ